LSVSWESNPARVKASKKYNLKYTVLKYLVSYNKY
jgi:hypothetical protein